MPASPLTPTPPTSAESPAPAASRGERDFHIFWAGQTLSALGDAFNNVALPLLVLRATGSLARMGMITAVTGAGTIIAGLVSGAVVDRVDRRRLMIACDVFRALTTVAIAVAFSLGHGSFALLIAVAAVNSVLGNLFQVAAIAAVVNLVERERLIVANARMQGGYALMLLLGPPLAGLLCQRFGPAAAIGLDGLSFVASSLSLAFVRLRRATGAGRAASAGLVAELLAGARFLFAQPVLRAVAVLFALTGLLQTARIDLLVYYIRHTLGRGDDDVGYVFGAVSLGSVVLAAVAARIRSRVGFGPAWLAAGALAGVGFVAVGHAHTLWGVAAAGTLIAGAGTVQGIYSMSVRQEVTPEHLIGRVTSAFWTVINLTTPAGALLTTLLAERVGIGPLCTLIGVGTLLLMLAGCLGPVRRHA